MDVHTFDGQLLEIKTFLLPYLEISPENKFNVFQQLKILIGSNVTFDIIVNNSKSNENYDPTNDLYADDLLYICGIIAENIPDKDSFVSTFNEQLTDMSTGMCAQGRVHRLFQIIIAFEEFL
jgi:hypothetical protein